MDSCCVLTKSRVLPDKASATVEITLEKGRAVCLEKYSDYKQLGRFMLRRGGETIAAGIVTDILRSNL